METLLPSYTIDEWCEIEKVSRTKFYRLRQLGTGPKLMRVGGRYMISHDAALAWREARTAEALEAA
ncbi:helix-turn-helix domain-containing protein [Mesorhizobium sp. CA16]|uniref:helix-turn-helix domain-containing protein n=1 Tax=Mesorhizobium sp. CA16 TaxID=588496 RepID=UPI001CCE36E2|nr:helix-turn-helix domain-containing protein [Mesorhizobium sp. CA16]MBZ9914016.1 helix-turn-helix domain-containing protein [Mesorhizobium sp. CA16]